MMLLVGLFRHARSVTPSTGHLLRRDKNAHVIDSLGRPSVRDSPYAVPADRLFVRSPSGYVMIIEIRFN
jgi:hypothetical protein